MPTVAQLTSRVSLYTGLQNTGDELALILEFLNECYQQAVEESECYIGIDTVAYGAGLDSVSLSGVSPSIIKVIDVSLTDYTGYESITLEPLSARAMSDKRHMVSDNSGIPRYYSITSTLVGGTPAIDLYPSPDEAATVTIRYVANPLILVSSTPVADVSETTPTAIPAFLHHRCISNGAIAMCFDREGRYDKAETFWNRFRDGVNALASRENEINGDRQGDPFFNDYHRLGDEDRSRDI